MKLVLVLFLSLVILSATILTQQGFAKTKFDKTVNKQIDKLSKKKHWDDICSVVAVRKDNVSKLIDNTKCSPVIPEPPKNKPPIIVVDSPIKCVVGIDCSMTSKITDSDGNITMVNWTQKQGSNVNLTISSDGWVATFVPVMNETLIFNVKATDNNGSSTNKDITVNVGSTEIPCPAGTHKDGNQCVPDPIPNGNHTDIALVGDLSGTTVLNSIKNAKVDYAMILGDYYQSSASGVTSILNNIKTIAPQVQCLLGNHESANEDGNQQVQDATTAICGDHWSFKIGNVGFIGFNSNNLGSTVDIPQNVSSMVIMSHKPCQTIPPNQHHPLESAVVKYCNDLKQRIDSNVKLYFLAGHEHVSANNADKTSFLSGSGGRSHYTCGTSTEWPFCQNQKYGYLEMDIDKNTGEISTQWKLN